MTDLTHLQFVAVAYLTAGIVVLYLIVRISWDYRRRLQTLTELEASGVYRRSEKK